MRARLVMAVVGCACALLCGPYTAAAWAGGDPIAAATAGVAVVRTAEGVGTAFAVADGRLLTAAHVVGAASTVQLVADGRTASARVERISSSMDLALLSTTMKLTPLTLRGHPPRLGEPVFAVGAALGDLSVTRGVVSGQRDADGFSHVQTDAAVNPGNSGGPLLGDDGQVIGLVVSKLRDAEGIALAVSAADLTSFLSGLARPALGGGMSPTPVAGSGSRAGARGASTTTGQPWWWLTLPLAGMAYLVHRRPRRLRVRLGPVRAIASPSGPTLRDRSPSDTRTPPPVSAKDL